MTVSVETADQATSEARSVIADDLTTVHDADIDRSNLVVDQADVIRITRVPTPGHHDSAGVSVLDEPPFLTEGGQHTASEPVSSPADSAPLEGLTVGDRETDTGAIPLPPPRRQETGETKAGGERGAAADTAVPVDGVNGRIHDSEFGRWLLLRDAVREIGSLEHLYRLARDGTLQSREATAGQIEVWVTDLDCLNDARPRPLRAERAMNADIPNAPSLRPYEQDNQVANLIAHLVAGHEQHLQLARENGALSERVPALERDLQELRESSASDKQALQAVQQRLEDVVGANIGLTALLQSQALDSPPARGRGLWWCLLLIVILLAATTGAVMLLVPR